MCWGKDNLKSGVKEASKQTKQNKTVKQNKQTNKKC